MATIRSIGDAGINSGGQAFGLFDERLWSELIGTIKDWAGILLVVALAGVGLSTNIHSFKSLGLNLFLWVFLHRLRWGL